MPTFRGRPHAFPSFLAQAVMAVALATGPGLSAAAPAPTTAASWRGDARLVVAAIDSIYPRPCRALPRASLDSAAADLEARFAIMRPEQAIGGFSRLLALLGDGHSRLDQVQLPSHGRPALAPLPWPGFQETYPVDFEVFADGLWIVGATSAHADLPGTKVLAIDGRPTAEAVSALTPLISRDNPLWILRMLPAYLRCPGYLAAAGLATDALAPLRLTLAAKGGTRRDVTLNAERPDSSARWLAADRDTRVPLPLTRRLRGPWAFADLDDSTVFARIQAIVNDPGGERLSGFAARLFAHLDSLRSPRLVVDLRGNGGGDGYLNQPIVHAILARPSLDRTGRLFAITDRGTFSAAVMLACDLERETHALFVGEPTGGAPDSPGDPAHVLLPGSGLTARISSVLWNGSDPRDPRAFIAPDLPAVPRFADWLAHRDPALAAIAAYQAPAPGTPEPPPNQHWGQKAKLEAKPPRIDW